MPERDVEPKPKTDDPAIDTAIGRFDRQVVTVDLLSIYEPEETS